MSISTDQAAHMAQLARIKTSPQQAELDAAQLSEILELVGRMEKFDTADVEPMAHPHEAALRMRDDCTHDEGEARREKYRALAPMVAAPVRADAGGKADAAMKADAAENADAAQKMDAAENANAAQKVDAAEKVDTAENAPATQTTGRLYLAPKVID